jgi:hypothetical protein
MFIFSTVLYIFLAWSLIKHRVTVVIIIINIVNELSKARGHGLNNRDSILWQRG